MGRVDVLVQPNDAAILNLQHNAGWNGQHLANRHLLSERMLLHKTRFGRLAKPDVVFPITD